MMRLFCILFHSVLLGVCSSACAFRSSIVIPESGENASSLQTGKDASGRIILDLSGSVNEIRYRHFTIRNPHDPRFAVRVTENTPDLARWDHADPPPHVFFQAKVARDRLPFIVHDNADLRDHYTRIYKSDPFIIRFSVEMSDRDGQQVAVFQTRSRRPDGRLILTKGFASLDPVDPDYIIEASCVISGYEKDLAAPGLEDLGRIFLDCVHIDDPE